MLIFHTAIYLDGYSNRFFDGFDVFGRLNLKTD